MTQARTASASAAASAASWLAVLAATRARRYCSARSVRALLTRCARSSVATACRCFTIFHHAMTACNNVVITGVSGSNINMGAAE